MIGNCTERVNSVPIELRSRKQWLTWTLSDDRKVPNGRSNDSNTWHHFEDVERFEKIAFVFSKDDPFCGIDLDGCIVDGQFTEWSKPILVRFRGIAYCEISPSGNGVKFTTRGEKPQGSRCVKKTGEGKQQIECYDHGRFWTITGNVLAGFEQIGDGQAAVDWLLVTYLEKDSEQGKPSITSTFQQPVNYDELYKRCQAYVDAAGQAVEGERNHKAFRLAGNLRAIDENGRRLSESEILDYVLTWNAKNLSPISDTEIKEAVASSLRNGTARPIKESKSIPTFKNYKPNERPRVEVTLTEGYVADQVVEHLGKLGWDSPWIQDAFCEIVKVYSRGGSLVHAIENEDPNNLGQLSIRPLPAAITRERITQACELIKLVSNNKGQTEEVPIRPQKWLIDAVHQRGYYCGHVKPLVGVIQAPTIRADGSILQTPGYDEATALLYRPAIAFPSVPENPTREDAQRAFNVLCEVVEDFPFLEDADRTAWVAMLLSMIGRASIAGCVPMFAITANIRGAGKSLLVDASSIVAYGRIAARRTFTRDDSELRKAITAIALEAVPSVLFDNLDSQLGGAALDCVLTSESWTDRVLGSSKTTGELPMRTVWSITGNNMSFGSDVARRVLPIRLQSDLETPENRSGFVHPDLIEWVRVNRPALATSALTILRSYFVAGCPVQIGGEWGSYEAWSRVIRGALVWCGAADPLPTRKTATESDDTKNLLGMLITGIEEADPDDVGVTVKEIERLVSHRSDETTPCPTLLEAVAEICGDRFNGKRFGKKLKSFIGRTWGGRKISREPGRGNVSRWSVKTVGSVGMSGFANSTLTRVSEPKTPDMKLSKSNQPNPPNQPCPKCKGVLKTGFEVLGWVNLECTFCDYIKPVELNRVQV